MTILKISRFFMLVDLGLPLTPGIMSVLSAKLPQSVFQAVLTGSVES